MRVQLFRQQAIDHQRERLVGDVVLTRPISGSIWALALVVFLVTTSTFLAFGSYTRKQRVQGYLVPSEGTVEVYPPRNGFVAATPVKMGDKVAMGDPILEVSDNRALEGGASLDAAFVETLEARKALLSRQMDWVDSNEIKRRRFLRLRVENLEARVQRLKERTAVQVEHLALVEQRYALLTNAREDDVISGEELQHHHERCLVERKSLKQLELALLEASSSLDESNLELALLEGTSDNQNIELLGQISALEQQILRQKGDYRYVITAPAAGKVVSMEVSRGQRVHSGSPVIVILPEDFEMKADLFVPTSAIGFVEDGLAVNVRYDAFPYERFGVYPAAIDFVSNAVLRPSQLDVPLLINEPVYRVRASLGHQVVRAYERTFALQAGMRLEADILIDERPLLHWLLRPLFSLKEAL